MALKLSLLQQLNLLDLYSSEIKSRLQREHYELGPLKELLSIEKLEELYDAEVKTGDWTKFSEDLWPELRNSSMKKILYSSILRFLLDVDRELHQRINLDNYEHEFIVGFKRLLLHAPEILQTMNLKIVMETLKNISGGFQEIIRPMEDRLQSGSIDETHAKNLLLRSIPLMSSNAYQHFLHAIRKCGPTGIALVDRIYPLFDQDYKEICTGITPRGIIHVVNPRDSIMDVLKAAKLSKKDSKYAVDLRFKNISEVHSRAYWIDITKEHPLNLRSYQEELTENALKGHNVVICAPTNSEKTIVAAYIIRHHIYEHIKEKKPFKICFFVPSTAILAQQYEVMKTYLNHCAKIIRLSGEDQAPVQESIHNNDIVIITPQMIVNLIQEKPIEGIDTYQPKPFCLTTFSMLVFDEAHHTDECYPYNVIMDHLKMTRAYEKNKKLPQIIGLTASLGVGKSKTIEDALNYLIKNLDAHCVSKVQVAKFY